MDNYSFQNPYDDIQDGAVINDGNFSQIYPDTEILQGKTLTINGGNWTNVKQQPEWTINGGNWTQINFCSHLHSNLIPKGLVECVDNCIHVTAIDEIYADDILIDTIYTYGDILS